MTATSVRKATRTDVLECKHTYRLFVYADGTNKIEDWIYGKDGALIAINEYRNVPQPNIDKIFNN